MDFDALLRRLKERKLVQWAVAYLAGAWALVEATSLVVDQFSLPAVLGQVVTVVAFFGFFLTLVLAWYHGEKGYQSVRGSELILITVVLVVAGVALSRLEGTAGARAQPAAGDALSEMARFAAAGAERPTLAVLPLANLSAETENAYFAAGIHEELLRQLSLVRALAVISRTSVLQYASTMKGIRQIAAELGARYIMEGSVQEADGRIRIQAQLIDAASDEHVWAERYDRSVADVFALQTEVAEAIAGALRAVIAPDEQERLQELPTKDPIAYDLYLQTSRLSYALEEDYETAVELLRRATELDPDFALAHARLASVFWNGMVSRGYPPMDSALARAERAVEAAPTLPEALAERGVLLASSSQFDRARADLLQALELNPNLGSAWGGLAAAAWWSGDPAAAALAARRGVRLDPHGLATNLNLAYGLGHLGMFREGAAWARALLEARPGDMYSLQILALYAQASGDTEASRRYREQLVQAGGQSPFVVYNAALLELANGNLDAAMLALRQVVSVRPAMSINGTPTAQALLAWVEDRQGVPGARERLEKLLALAVAASAERTNVVLLADLTILAAARGDLDAAAAWFQEAGRRDQVGTLYVFMRDFPIWDAIRDRPEFQVWLRDTEERLAAGRRALAAFGGWMPEDILGGLQP